MPRVSPPERLAPCKVVVGGGCWAPPFLDCKGSWGGGVGGEEMPLRVLPLQVKCLQEALLRATSSVFALNSCFPTHRTDFGGPRCREKVPVPGGRGAGDAGGMRVGWGQEGWIRPSALVLVAMNSRAHQQESRSG